MHVTNLVTALNIFPDSRLQHDDLVAVVVHHLLVDHSGGGFALMVHLIGLLQGDTAGLGPWLG